MNCIAEILEVKRLIESVCSHYGLRLIASQGESLWSLPDYPIYRGYAQKELFDYRNPKYYTMEIRKTTANEMSTYVSVSGDKWSVHFIDRDTDVDNLILKAKRRRMVERNQFNMIANILQTK